MESPWRVSVHLSLAFDGPKRCVLDRFDGISVFGDGPFAGLSQRDGADGVETAVARSMRGRLSL
jgi:hypothetical protein